MGYIVYKHTCPNGKIYIGITRQAPEKRWQNGKHYDGQIFYRAIQKYGWNNIKHEILFENLTQAEAEQKEIELITFYKSDDIKYGYNMSSGGKGGNGYVRSDEHREKISVAFRGENHPMYGKHHTEETRLKMSLSHKGNKLSDEAKRKLSIANKGKHHTQETRVKISQGRKGIKFSDETLKKMKESNRTKRLIKQYSINGEYIQTFESIKEAERFLGKNKANAKICACCKGKVKTAYGFIWRYNDE